MDKLFGTDGIRGKTDTFPMTEQIVAKVGFAVASIVGGGDRSGPSKILIGRDTRSSGKKFEKALISGICNFNNTVCLSGVIPTPGVSYLVSSSDFDAGIVISASHNPYDDNGIKIFDGNGYKLTDKKEDQVEKRVLNTRAFDIQAPIEPEPFIQENHHFAQSYVSFLKTCINTDISLNGMKLVIDCANGATSFIAPELFADLGAHVIPLSITPNGANINDNCGSEYPNTMAKTVINENADMGIAFDGDGDRVVVADETGKILTGDQILAVLASFLKYRGELKSNTVVSTIMSNMGLRVSLRHMAIDHVITDVGDRYVTEKMKETGAILGGEDSGHIILMDHQKTGDGMVTALRLLEVLHIKNKPLSELKKIMSVYPQELINVDVPSKPDLKAFPEIMNTIKAVEEKLDAQGRVLVRYSGTQSICRVMVEGPNAEQIKGYCKEISDVIKKNIK